MSTTAVQPEAVGEQSTKSMLSFSSNGKQSSSFLQYLTNTKSLLGIVILIFGIYLMTNDWPVSWSNYQASVQKVVQAEQQRKTVLENLSRLQSTSKNIKPLEASIYKLNGAESPEIATLRIAQDVVRLAQSTKNKYVSLTPLPVQKIDFSSVVDIAINPDAGSTPPAEDQNTAPAAPDGSAEAAPQGIQPVDGQGSVDPAAAGPVNPATSVQCAVYVLNIKGSMRSLAEFVYQLTSYETLIFLKKIRIGTGDLASVSAASIGIASVQGAPGTASGTDAAAGDKNDITVELTFQVPWSQ